MGTREGKRAGPNITTIGVARGEDRLLDVSSNLLVSFEDLGYELPFPVAGHRKALDLACWGHEVAGVAVVALAVADRRELPIAGSEVLSHLLFEHLLEHDLNPLAYPNFDIPLNDVFGFFFSGQVHPS